MFFIKEKECLISVESLEAHYKKLIEIVNECEDIAKFTDYTDLYMKNMKMQINLPGNLYSYTADAKQTVKNTAK